MSGEWVLSGRELSFQENEIIVSKTDLTGRITYCNDVFIRVSGYREKDLLGQPHKIIRHPKMPRTIFRLLWNALSQGQELFAYIVNRCRDGDYYWVFAHVTPDFDQSGRTIGFHSNRRVVRPAVLAEILPLYARLAAEEAKHEDRKTGLDAGSALFESILREKGRSYERFVCEL